MMSLLIKEGGAGGLTMASGNLAAGMAPGGSSGVT